MNTNAASTPATGRELVLKFIGEAIERVLDDDVPDFAEESTRILDEIEARCTGRIGGDLIFGDTGECDALMEGA